MKPVKKDEKGEILGRLGRKNLLLKI